MNAHVRKTPRTLADIHCERMKQKMRERMAIENMVKEIDALVEAFVISEALLHLGNDMGRGA